MRALVAAATLTLLAAGAPAVAHSSPAGAPTGSVAGSERAEAVWSGAAASHASSRPTVVRTKSRSLRVVRLSDARPAVGTRVVVTGRTTVKPRRVVLQQRRADGSWKRVARTTAKRGQFRMALPRAKAGVRAYRVVVPRVAKRKQKQPRAVSPRFVLRAATPSPRPFPAPQPPAPQPPAPQPPAPGPQDAADAAEVTAEVERLVRDYREQQGLLDPVGSNACLTDWAGKFAGRMVDTGIFAHSVSPEWRAADVVRADETCVGQAPALRAEAIDWVAGSTPQEVAAAVVADWKAAWMHDEVLLDDFGTNRSFSFGAARGLSPVSADGARTEVWYVVAVVARDLP